MASLKQISREQIWKSLSADARESLIGEIYVPYLENVADIFYEITDEHCLDQIFAEFREKFPEVVQSSPEVIPTKYEVILKYPGRPLSPLLGIKIQCEGGSWIISNGIPFDFNRNNQLINFFMKHNMPVFVGIKSLVKQNSD